MTSSNINKIVRSNINLKPWILSKNTSEIVNTCIQKIYKQSQTNFKNDLMQPKSAAARAENKGPIRSLKTQERIRPPISFISRPKRDLRSGTNGSGGGASAGAGTGAGTAGGGGAAIAGSGPRFASAAMQGKKSAVANLAANKRLLRSSPNYKIYSSRRFGSSASSSNASIFRRSEDRRRINQTTQLNYLLRSFTTNRKAPSTQNYGSTSSVARYALQARNQHMQSVVNSAAPASGQAGTSLQRDLMAIDHTVKERIAMGRKGLKMHRRNKDIDPLNGWNHPPPPELFMPSLKAPASTNLELQQQYQRLKIVNRMRQFEQLQQMENRASLLGSVGRKHTRGRPLDAFGAVMEESPRATPHQASRQSVLERARRTSMRRMAISAAMEQLATETQSIKLPPPATTATSTIPEAAFVTESLSTSKLGTLGAPANPNIAAQAASTEPASSASHTLVPPLPASAMAPASSRGQSPPSPTATSMLAAANRSSVGNSSRFNRSAYNINKF